MFGSKKTTTRKPRPGRRMLAEQLESRRLLTSSMGWDGPGLGTAQLTYHVANTPAGLSQAETDAAIETALDAWSSVVDIEFTQTDQAGQRDSLDISFARIDGTGGTLAQAYFPDDVNPARIAGDIQFDTSESWEVGNEAGRSAFDLVYVAVHEIGHALGLDHSDAEHSILAPTVSPNQSFSSLDQDDIEEIQSLYAPRIPTEGTENGVTGNDVTGNPPISEGTPQPFGPEQLPAPELPTPQRDTPPEQRVWQWYRTTIVVTRFQTNRQPYHWKISWSRSPGDADNSFQVNANQLASRSLVFEILHRGSQDAAPDNGSATQDATTGSSASTLGSGHVPAATPDSSGVERNPRRFLRYFRW